MYFRHEIPVYPNLTTWHIVIGHTRNTHNYDAGMRSPLPQRQELQSGQGIQPGEKLEQLELLERVKAGDRADEFPTERLHMGPSTECIQATTACSCQTSLDHLLEPPHDRYHPSLIDNKAQTRRICIVEPGGPRTNDPAVCRVVLGV